MDNYYIMYTLTDGRVVLFTHDANHYAGNEYCNLRMQFRRPKITEILIEDLKRDNLLRVAESEDGFVISLKDHIPYEFNGCVKPKALGNITLRSLERHLVGRDRSRDRDFISANLPDGCGHSNWDNKDIELPRFRFVNMPVLDVELSDLV